jgi:hypothetical protein
MANGGSAATGAIEGFLGGFERGAQFRRQRTSDKLALEDRQRRLVAEELQRGRERVQDEQAAAVEARRAIEFTERTGLVPLVPGAPPVDAPGDPVSGISTTGGDFNPLDDPSGIRLGDITPSIYGAGPADDPSGIRLGDITPSIYRRGQLPEDVDQLRRAVGEDLRAGTPAAVEFPGFRRVGPSADERELESETALRASVSAYLTATPEERAVMEQDPQVIGALHELGQLTGVMRRSAEAAQPVSPSPLQLLTGEGGLMSTFDPRGDVGERVEPLLGPGGDQFRGRVPDDNFARSAAINAANAISRIDRNDFYGDPELIAAEVERIAMQYGFADLAHMERVISAAVGGGADVGGGERSAQELWDAAVEEIGREEALRRLGPRPNG